MPILHLFLRVRKTQESVRVPAFNPEASFKRLDKCIVRRLVKLVEVQRDAIRVCPQIEFAGDELGAQIDADRLRIARPRTDPFQGPNNIFTPVAEPRIEYRHIARLCIDNRQHTYLSTGRELIVDKVHRPGFVRPGRCLPVLPQIRLHPALWCFVP